MVSVALYYEECLSANEISRLVKVDEMMKKEQYVQILNSKIKQSAEKLGLEHQQTSQQSNDREYIVSEEMVHGNVNIFRETCPDMRTELRICGDSCLRLSVSSSYLHKFSGRSEGINKKDVVQRYFDQLERHLVSKYIDTPTNFVEGLPTLKMTKRNYNPPIIALTWIQDLGHQFLGQKRQKLNLITGCYFRLAKKK